VAVVAMHHFIIKFLGELTLQGYSCGGQQWNGRFLYRPSGCLFLRQLLKTSSGYLSVPSYQFWQNANASYTTRSIRVKKDAKKFTVHKDNIFLPCRTRQSGVCKRRIHSLPTAKPNVDILGYDFGPRLLEGNKELQAFQHGPENDPELDRHLPTLWRNTSISTHPVAPESIWRIRSRTRPVLRVSVR
jgi:hypothetical protein